MSTVRDFQRERVNDLLELSLAQVERAIRESVPMPLILGLVQTHARICAMVEVQGALADMARWLEQGVKE